MNLGTVVVFIACVRSGVQTVPWYVDVLQIVWGYPDEKTEAAVPGRSTPGVVGRRGCVLYNMFSSGRIGRSEYRTRANHGTDQHLIESC